MDSPSEDVEPKLTLIAKDMRGASWSLLFPDNREAVLIFTRKGFYRGGHSHDKPETSIVLTGRMRYRKMTEDGKENTFTQGPGDVLYNKPGEIHLAHALEDGWLMDWKINTLKGEATSMNYPPYRKFVDEQMGGSTK